MSNYIVYITFYKRDWRCKQIAYCSYQSYWQPSKHRHSGVWTKEIQYLIDSNNYSTKLTPVFPTFWGWKFGCELGDWMKGLWLDESFCKLKKQTKVSEELIRLKTEDWFPWLANFVFLIKLTHCVTVKVQAPYLWMRQLNFVWTFLYSFLCWLLEKFKGQLISPEQLKK